MSANMAKTCRKFVTGRGETALPGKLRPRALKIASRAISGIAMMSDAVLVLNAGSSSINSDYSIFRG
jgi:hypothetical protein